jgi:hypothetical protein
MKGFAWFTIALVFLGFGVLLLVSGALVPGLLGALLGAASLCGLALRRGQHRGDPRAGRAPRGPYLVLGLAILAIGAAMGAIMIIFTPVTSYRYTVLMGTPAASRILGTILVALCVLGLVTLLIRSRRPVEH